MINKKQLEYLLYHDFLKVYTGDAKFNNPEGLSVNHEKEIGS